MSLNRCGIPAQAVEAADLLNYGTGLPHSDTLLFYISQSGTSGEVAPLLQNLPKGVTVVAITNNPSSELARRAVLTMPMVAGSETLVATKTYVNTIALLWTFARYICAGHSRDIFESLRQVSGNMEELLAQTQITAARLMNTFDESQPLLFVGHGPHAATARHAAMIMSEWSKVAALNAGIGAFRHGFIETICPGFGVVVFAAPGSTSASALALAKELSGYGARILLVENGALRSLEEPAGQVGDLDEFLSPILDIIPIQIYTEALARKLGFGKGFRYIGKVVSNI
jgi:glucosamine--fructose-6-phosphate aminotransferase (isomerizing)